MVGSKEDLSSGVTVKNGEENQGFSVTTRVENPMSQPGGLTMAATSSSASMGGVSTSYSMRKRRGRPRNYDGGVAPALSPMPISASIPLTGDMSGWKQPRARGFQTIKKAHKVEFGNVGDRFSHFCGGHFTPHTLLVNAGEDIAMKIMSFCQQSSRAICVLSAIGSISNVTLHHPNSSGGTLTYQGNFELISLSGSFMLTDNGIVKSRCGGVSVSLAGADGRVFGGGLAGLLIAATPVQMVLGSFLSCYHQERKPKKQRIEPVPSVIQAVINQVPDGRQNVNFASPPPTCRTDSLSSMNSSTLTQITLSTQHYPMDLEANNTISPEGDSDDFDDGVAALSISSFLVEAI